MLQKTYCKEKNQVEYTFEATGFKLHDGSWTKV